MAGHGWLRRGWVPGHGWSALGLLPDTQNCGLRMCRECRKRFSRHQLQRKLLVSDPGMHHGTYVTHVPWCMSGSLTCGGGENVPGACTTLNFAYLVRGPWPTSWLAERLRGWLGGHMAGWLWSWLARCLAGFGHGWLVVAIVGWLTMVLTGWLAVAMTGCGHGWLVGWNTAYTTNLLSYPNDSYNLLNTQPTRPLSYPTPWQPKPIPYTSK